MSSPREMVLAEGIVRLLFGIQKSEQIYKDLSRLDRKMLRTDEKEKYRVSKIVAANVEKYYKSKRGKIAPDGIKEKIQEELKRIWYEKRKR